jgi:hypothetical protein
MQVSFKSRIPKMESYPLKLSDLERALEGVPQFERLDVSFWRYETVESRAEDVKRVLSLHYSRSKVGLTVPAASVAQLIEPKWRVQISPVPRDLRHRIHDLLIAGALPHAKEWLTDAFKKDGEVGAFWVDYKYDFGLEKLVMPRKTEVRGT